MNAWRNLKTLSCLLVAISTSSSSLVIASAQTEAQMSSRYKRAAVFFIRPDIQVMPSFSSDGNVCRMVIEKQPYVEAEKVSFDSTISPTLADQLVDELVPPVERGKSRPFVSSDSSIAGGSSFIKQDYENVSVAMYGSGSLEHPETGAKIITITWLKRQCR